MHLSFAQGIRLPSPETATAGRVLVCLHVCCVLMNAGAGSCRGAVVSRGHAIVAVKVGILNKTVVNNASFRIPHLYAETYRLDTRVEGRAEG